MSPAILQSLMARTRNNLNIHHSSLVRCFQGKAEAVLRGSLEDEYFYHNAIKEGKKEIARLVLVKKALKASYFEELAISKMEAWEHGNVYE